MTNRQTIVLTFLLGALLGGAIAKPAKAAGFTEVVRVLERIADEVAEIRRGGLKCHE